MKNSDREENDRLDLFKMLHRCKYKQVGAKCFVSHQDEKICGVYGLNMKLGCTNADVPLISISVGDL